MNRRLAVALGLALAGGCDHGDSRSGLELKKETLRRLDASIGVIQAVSSPQPPPVSSPVPFEERVPPDAGVPDAGKSPVTHQAPPPTNQAPNGH